MKGKSLISITDYNKDEYLKILEIASSFKANPRQRLLDNYVVASLFFEPSTRTRLSFETAANRLGARVVGFSESGSTSLRKGESLKDTIKMVSSYADIIVMRHPVEGSSRWASEVSSVPVINAGDGSNQHPTQCLLDLYSIKETQGTLDNLNIALVGDLKYGRTVHSLVEAMSNFNTTFQLVSPIELKLPRVVKMYIKNNNLTYTQHIDIKEVMPTADIVYMTRIQKERFNDPMEYEKVKNSYSLTASMLGPSKPNMKILHPLPRVNEINEDVDNTRQAYYFKQAENGIYVRQALLAAILGVVK
ncbi:MAG: aspartate carbamoyltransferase [Bacteroidales bacterium]|jgi:aspartate carbamoyltransferase catalytic subunit